MHTAKVHQTESCDDWDRLSTEELVEWALDRDDFGAGAFVWDLRHGLDLEKKILSEIDLPQKGSDELPSNLSPDDRSPLSRDRRRRGR